MKKILYALIILPLCLQFFACANRAAEATQPLVKAAEKIDPNPIEKKYADLAVRIVRDSAGVKPGDVVIISGGKHTIPLMEALAIEANKLGGMSNLFLGSDRVNRSFYLDVPDKFLAQEPRFFAEWLKHTNVFINLPDAEDQKAAFADIPEERFAKASKAGEFFPQILNQLPVRQIYINYPSNNRVNRNQAAKAP